jgi:hypothetical protein
MILIHKIGRIKEGAGKRPRPGSIGIGRVYFPAPA